MQTPARILRNTATRADPHPDRLTEREHRQCSRILDLGQALMATHGRHTMTMAAFAVAIGHSTGTIRRHFPDLDSLLAHILHRHLLGIARALGHAARASPDDQPALRRAYAEATRTALGAPTEAHLLLTRDRHLLPEDELEIVERTRSGIAETLAGELGQHALLLLDHPGLPAAEAEAMLRTLHEARQTPAGSAAAPPPDQPALAAPAPPAGPDPHPLLTLDQISARWPKPAPRTAKAHRARAGPAQAA